MKMQLTQVEIEAVYDVICAAPTGCFSGLYQDMRNVLGYNPKAMGIRQAFVDLCKRYCMGQDANYDTANMVLDITNKALKTLNVMLVHSGYNVIKDDEDDRGLDINIL